MKRLHIACLLLLGLAAPNAPAQGTVVFANNSMTEVTLFGANAELFGLPPGSGVPGGDLFWAELYYAPAGADPGDAGMLQGRMGPPVHFSTLAPGRFNGGVRTTPATTPPGANAWFQIRVWEAAFGDTFEEAAAAGPRLINGCMRVGIIGASARFNLATGFAPLGSPIPITTDGGLQAFSIGFLSPPDVCIPEPSLPLLLLLGGGAAGWCCRRKPRPH